MGIERALGRHFLADFFCCDQKVITDLDALDEALNEASHIANVHVIKRYFHKYSPHGITGILILEESHIAIHTWPEFDYVAADAFTCGDKSFVLGMTYLKVALGAKYISHITEMERGRIPAVYLGRYRELHPELDTEKEEGRDGSKPPVNPRV